MSTDDDKLATELREAAEQAGKHLFIVAVIQYLKSTSSPLQMETRIGGS